MSLLLENGETVDKHIGDFALSGCILIEDRGLLGDFRGKYALLFILRHYFLWISIDFLLIGGFDYLAYAVGVALLIDTISGGFSYF